MGKTLFCAVGGLWIFTRKLSWDPTCYMFSESLEFFLCIGTLIMKIGGKLTNPRG